MTPFVLGILALANAWAYTVLQDQLNLVAAFCFAIATGMAPKLLTVRS